MTSLQELRERLLRLYEENPGESDFIETKNMLVDAMKHALEINIYNDLCGLLVECDSLAHKNGLFIDTLNSPRFVFYNAEIKSDLILRQIKAGVAINLEHFYGSMIARQLRNGIESKPDEFRDILWKLLLNSKNVLQAHQLIYYYSITLEGVDKFYGALKYIDKKLMSNISKYESTLLKSALLMGASHAGIDDAAVKFRDIMYSDAEFAEIFISFIARNYYGSVNDLALDYLNKIKNGERSSISLHTRMPVLSHLKKTSNAGSFSIINDIL